MNNVNVGPQAFANFVTPFNPVGKQAVGLENTESREEPLSPVEEGSETAAPLNRDDGSPEAVNADDQRDQSQQQKTEEADRQQQQQDQQTIRQLAARDREVRAHEAAHAAVGGQYAGAPSFQYERGPDGVSYAVAGEVPIAVPTRGNNPEATLRAAEQVRRAALAPAEPSAQDRRVAARATQLALQARADISAQQTQEAQAERDEKAVAEAEAQKQREEEEAAREARQSNEQQLQAQDDARRRFNQFSDQLVNLEDDKLVGSLLDRRA